MDFESAQACLIGGGVFSLLIPPITIVLLVLEALWLLWAVVRELKRRADLGRIRDLVIEGSLGQAILVADARSNDDLLAVCRAGMVAVQNSGDRQTAWDKLVVEAGFRYGGARRALPKVVALGIAVAIPVGLAIGSRAYARNVLHEAEGTVPDIDRPQLRAAAEQDIAYSCPVYLGLGAALAVALPAALIGAIEVSRYSARARDFAVKQADELTAMSARVLDPTHRVYQAERDRR